jgi:antitoxin component of MazEF toxin-antitoxin module
VTAIRRLGKRSTSVALTVPVSLAAALQWEPGTLVLVELSGDGLLVRTAKRSEPGSAPTRVPELLPPPPVPVVRRALRGARMPSPGGPRTPGTLG